MLITTGGVLIRTRVAEIRQMGRATQGVTLINLGAEEKLAGLEKVVESEENGAAELDPDSTTASTGSALADSAPEDVEPGSENDVEPGSDDDSDRIDEGGSSDTPPEEPDNQ
jgi:DNA gyrase subunit A